MFLDNSKTFDQYNAVVKAFLSNYVLRFPESVMVYGKRRIIKKLDTDTASTSLKTTHSF